MLDDLTLDCDCGGNAKYSITDVAEGRTVRCSNGCSLRLKDADGSARAVEKSVRDLERALDGLGGTTNIKL